MHSIEAGTANVLYQDALRDLFYEGQTVSPRGKRTLELSPVSLKLSLPQFNIITDPDRKASKAFMAAELLWILMGREDLAMLEFYNGQMAQYSDDGQNLAGAYGPRIMSQLRYVYETLKADPDSRQGVISIWRPCPEPSKDIPCTVALHFIIRHNMLYLYSYMRSNDAWLGFPYDLHNFTSIQIILARILGVEVGAYYHTVGSFHLYYDQIDNMKKFMVVKGAMMADETPTPMLGGWDQFQTNMALVRDLEALIRRDPDLAKRMIDTIACPFFKQKLQWLQEKAERKYATQDR